MGVGKLGKGVLPRASTPRSAQEPRTSTSSWQVHMKHADAHYEPSLRTSSRAQLDKLQLSQVEDVASQ